jgi:acyl-CoA dehydrogenase
MFGLAFGGVGLVRTALAAHKAGDGDPANAGRVAVMRFFAEQIITAMPGLETTVTQGAGAVHTADLALGA